MAQGVRSLKDRVTAGKDWEGRADRPACEAVGKIFKPPELFQRLNCTAGCTYVCSERLFDA